MRLANPIEAYRTAGDPRRRQAMANAYTPIVRSFLIPGAAYYTYITWRHWVEETGSNLVILASMSAIAVFCFIALRYYLSRKQEISLNRLEVAGLLANMLIYLNVMIYFMINFEPTKLVYFAIMAVVFSTTGVTLRITFFCVVLSLATLYWFASGLPSDLFAQYVSIGIATAVAAFGMASLLRTAILRQIDARLLADQLAAKAHHMADTDILTSLPNRRAIFKHLDELVARREPFWLGIYDLDGFKAINDIYGHTMGDKLLSAVVERGSAINMIGAQFGRIGGDEFIVILSGHETSAKVMRIAENGIERISQPYPVEGLQLTVGVSAGFAHFPSMASSTAELYEKADFALYKAKDHHRGQCVLFDTAEDDEMKHAIAIERELRESDLETELYLLFQPQYSPCEGRVVSFEALARWQNPKLGLVRPDDFIRAAERSGQIRRVTDILFAKALGELSKWPKDISLSFNLSAQDISNQTFILSLLAKIMESSISPERIEFEITETAVMSDFEMSKTLLETLRASGCKIALDDFGSGYSSFEYLDQLPLDKVKIDRSFIRKVAQSSTSREIVAGVIGLCRKLELRCVLEGVESEGEMMILSPMKPDLIQGYLYGRPLAASKAREMIDLQQGGERDMDSEHRRSLSA